ncbi:MAG: cell division protein FtsL [Gammaproteobacteria bacterium]
MKQLLGIALTASLALVTALSLVLTRFDNRQHFVQLQELRRQQNELNREFGQLLLEQSTWGTHGRIEELARTKLNMTVPRADQIRRARS